MQTNAAAESIQRSITLGGVDGYNGQYTPLGGGEVNDTYLLDCDEKKLVLRIAKDEGQRTLENEAHALQLLHSPCIPELIYFDPDTPIDNRLWILETSIPGVTPDRLTEAQLRNLGALLAQVHDVSDPSLTVDLKEQFLDNTEAFADEGFLLHHPDSRLQSLLHAAFTEFEQKQPEFSHVTPSLIHLDATPSNVLVNGDEVGLIDWEFSKFNDPMCDFSTIYYEDMEYNRGKWRIQITESEKTALFEGYEHAGGIIDEERIRFWIRFDKLGAAVFLYWRLHHSKRETEQAQLDQYQLDFNNILTSLSS